MERTKFKQPIPKTNKLIYSEQEEPIVLSKALLDLLLKESDGDNLIALYVFYYYTAKWQKTNQPKATTTYVMKGLGWGEDRVLRIKGRLKELNLVKDVIQRDSNGKIMGYFIKVNFIWSNHQYPFFTSTGEMPVQASKGINALSSNNKNALSSNREIFHNNDNKIIPPSLEMVKDYCDQRKNKIDPQAFISFYQSKGWMIGKNKMKDWQACIRTWETKDKQEGNKINTRFKPTFVYDDNGTKYFLNDNGEYRTKKGTLFIQ